MKVALELDFHETVQVLDGLEARAVSFENTAEFWNDPDEAASIGVYFEEVNDAGEAASIAKLYRSIIDKIREQMNEQEENQ